MKRFISVLLVLSMCMVTINGAFGATTQGDNTQEIENTDISVSVGNNLSASSTDTKYAVAGGYIYFNESTGTITDCDTDVTTVNIPSEINGVKVTSIGDSAFSNCSSLTSITIPEEVTNIGNSAFYNCSSLTSIEIPEGVTNIGDSVFYRCSNLISITIPEGVTSIGNSAFSNCSSLTSITIPEGVTNIGDSAFCACKKLTSIEIPQGVTNIGNLAFRICNSLTNINVASNNEYYKDINGVLFDKLGTKLILYPAGKKDNTYIIPQGVTSIEEYAFSSCSSLTSIEIPEGVTSIGNSAFHYCSRLTSIKLPEGVTSIGDSVFAACSSLTSIEIPQGVTSIGDFAFDNCSSLTSIEISQGVTSIGNSAFSSCNSLTNVELPEGVTSIGKFAFYWCRNLVSITIPKSVSSMEIDIFGACDNLSTIYCYKNSIADKYTYYPSLVTKVYVGEIILVGTNTFWFDNFAEDVVTGTDETGADITTKTVMAGDYSLTNGTLTLVPGLNGENYTVPEKDNFQNINRADRVVNAYKAGNRPTECNAFTKVPEAGSSLVFTPAVTGTLICYFFSTSFLRVSDFTDPTTAPVATMESADGAPYYAFNAEAGHTYVLSTTGKTNNCGYAGVEFIPDETITVNLSDWKEDGKYNYDNVVVTLTDTVLGTEAAKVDKNTKSVELAKGHTYTLSTNDGGTKATVNGADSFKVVDEGPITIEMTFISDITESTTDVTESTTDIIIDGDNISYPAGSGYIHFNKATGEVTGCDTSVTGIGYDKVESDLAIIIPDGYEVGKIVAIPSKILDTPVTRIGYGAFKNCSDIKAIFIPSTVTSMGNYAFYNSGITTVYCEKDSYADNANLYDPDTVIKYIGYSERKLLDNSPKVDGITIGSSNWSVTKENGNFLAKSQNTDNSSSSTITVNVTGPAVIYFEMAVSSEEGADTFIMRNNGNKVISMSGTDNYTLDNPYSNYIVLEDGENILTWKYNKDDEGSDGQDCAWLKNLRIVDKGDSNLDGKVDINDVVLGQKYLSDNSVINDPLGQKAINATGKITQADVAKILKNLMLK